MAGPRAGAEALVMERLVLRESSFPLPGRGPHGRQRDREYRISRLRGASRGRTARRAAIMRKERRQGEAERRGEAEGLETVEG